MITSPYELTPVERHEGILIKREDLFQPFGVGTVNGGKLRQCWFLVESVKDGYFGVISCCSLYSPQAPITSAVANHFGMKCVICYGGTKYSRLRRFRMPTISKRYGADIRIISKSGIHNILYRKAKGIAKDERLFVVDYGFNIVDHEELLLKAVSNQVENIPDRLDNLVITCGSGITTVGVFLGLARFRKQVDNIWLVCTAPDRSKLINGICKKHHISLNYRRIDLFHQKGFAYEKGLERYCDGIWLHPNYEAKAYDWLTRNIEARGKDTLLWCVGSKPMR